MRSHAGWLERLMFRTVELWVVGLLAVAAFLAWTAMSVVLRAAARGDDRFGTAGELALALSEAPEKVVRVVELLVQGDQADLEVEDDRFPAQRGWKFAYPAGSNPAAGYLLSTRYDGDRARSVVDFVDLNAQRSVFQWNPDFRRSTSAAG
jgi:hypothetical protein